MSRRAQQSGGGLTDRLPIGRAAGLGAMAYVAGYAVTYLFVELDVEESMDSLSQYGAGKSDFVGWAFYSTHFTDLKVSAESSSQTSTQTTNLISEATDLAIPEPIWYLIPVALLAGAGYLAASAVDRPGDSATAVKAGATVVAGYLPLAAIGTFLFTKSGETSTWTGTASYTIGPDKAMAIGLAGLAYPVVLGAIGGFLTTVVGDSGASQPHGGRGRPGQPRQGNARGQQRQVAQQRQRGQQGQAGGGQGGQRGRQRQDQRRGEQEQAQQRGGQQSGTQRGGSHQQDQRGGQQLGDDSRSRE